MKLQGPKFAILWLLLLTAPSLFSQVARSNRSSRVIEAPELRLPPRPELRVTRSQRTLPSRREKSVAAEPTPRLILPPISIDSVPVVEERSDTGRPSKRTRIGVVRPLNLSMETSGGQWSQAEPGIWRLEITSTDAVATQLHLSRVSLPPGVTLYISGSADPEAQVFRGRGPFLDGDIYAAPVDGSTVILEVEDTRASKQATANELFTIASVSHLFRSPIERATYFGDAGACNLDWSCYPDWASEGESVARIEFSDSQYIYVCSAVLLSNLTNDASPYLLTARHCIANVNYAKTMTVYWQYKTNSCNGYPANLYNIPYGRYESFLATALTSDMTLLSVTEPPPGSTYAGWTTGTPEIGTAVTGIHHPSGDYRRISFGATKVDTYNVNRYHGVEWSSGITEGGSSGSPLFSPDRKVIGTLSSGESSCENPHGTDDYYRFSLGYPTFVDGQGRNYLTMGLPDDSFAPNQTRATAATLPLGETDSMLLKPGADDWFKITVSAGQFLKLNFGYAGTLNTSAISGEVYLDSKSVPEATYDQQGLYAFYADGAPHTVYLHVALKSGVRVPYHTLVSVFKPLPPVLQTQNATNTSWDYVYAYYSITFNETPTTYWVEWSTDPTLANATKGTITTEDPNAPPYSLGRGDSFRITPLPPLTTVYYRVFATNLGGTVRTGIYSGTTLALPPPIIQWPDDGAVMQPYNGHSYPRLSWYGAADKFDLYVGTQPDPPLVLSDVTPYTTPQLHAGKYYWRVVSKFQFGTASSPIRSFTLLDTINPSEKVVDFGPVLLGVSAPDRTVTFTNNTEGQYFTGLTVFVTGDFILKSDTCTGSQLWLYNSCSVTVGYRANSLGASAGSVSLTAAEDFNSPHTVALNGNGVQFSLSPMRPSRKPRAALVKAGESITVPVQLSSSAAEMPAASLSCDGLPRDSSCSFSGIQSGLSSQTILVTITTTRRAVQARGSNVGSSVVRQKTEFDDRRIGAGTPVGQYNVAVVLHTSGGQRSTVIAIDVR